VSDLDALLDADGPESECIRRLLSALRGPSPSTPPESERTSRRPESAFARTVKVPVLNPLQGQTTPVGDDSIEKVVSALPSPENTAGTAIVARFTAWLRAKRAWQGPLCHPGQPSNQRAIPSK
jgi:hypothetical protein